MPTHLPTLASGRVVPPEVTVGAPRDRNGVTATVLPKLWRVPLRRVPLRRKVAGTLRVPSEGTETLASSATASSATAQSSRHTPCAVRGDRNSGEFRYGEFRYGAK